MAGLHNQVTNRPTLVIDDKINDVADRSFAGLDGVAAKSLCALQMKIVACLLTRHKMAAAAEPRENRPRPTFRIQILLIFILSRDWLVRLNRGTDFNLLPSRIHGEAVGVLMQVSESMGRNRPERPDSHEPVSATTQRIAHC